MPTLATALSFVALLLLVVLATTATTTATATKLTPRDWRNHGKYNAKHHHIATVVQQLSSQYPHMPGHEQRHKFYQMQNTDAPFTTPATNLTCGVCTDLAGDVFKSILTPNGMNNTYELLNDLICKKLNKTSEQGLCRDVVKIGLLIFSKIDAELLRLGFPLATIICADVLKQCIYPGATTPAVPEQIHLTFTNGGLNNNLAAMQQNYTVSWVTLENTTNTVAQWRVKSSASSGNGTTTTTNCTAYQREMTFGGFDGIMHNAVLSNLPHNQTIQYRVGGTYFDWKTFKSESAFSEWFEFNTLPLDVGLSDANPLRVIALADFGIENAADTIKQLINLAEKGDANGNKIHFIVLPGDLSYADGDVNKFNRWLRDLQPCFTRLPLVTQIGNHEKVMFDAVEYRYRFSSPGPNGEPAADPTQPLPADALYYSFRVNSVSFVMVNSEGPIDFPEIDDKQQQWIGQQLQTANSFQGGFTFVMQHRPLYCSNGHGTEVNADCGILADYVRSRVEKLYVDNKVDFHLSGHLHSYERTLPVANNKEAGSSYEYPNAPVYTVSGSPGNIEGQSDFRTNPDPWSAYRSDVVGFQILTFVQKPRSSSDNDGGDGAKHTSMKSVFYDSATMTALDSFELVSKR